MQIIRCDSLHEPVSVRLKCTGFLRPPERGVIIFHQLFHHLVYALQAVNHRSSLSDFQFSFNSSAEAPLRSASSTCL